MWPWLTRTFAACLLVAAAVVLLAQVQVKTTAVPGRSCGSAWDVVAGTTGWQEWWAQDLADPAGPGSAALVRTTRCADAVNARIVWSGVLAAGAVVLLGVGEAVARRRFPAARLAPSRAVGRARRLATALSVLGTVVAAAGVTATALLVADPHAPMFDYVSRPVVVVVGLLLTLPAVLLVVAGRAARMLADRLVGGEVDDGGP